MLATLGICKLSLGNTQPLTHSTVLGNCIATCNVVYKESKSGPERNIILEYISDLQIMDENRT
jgi:hypothetical protein